MKKLFLIEYESSRWAGGSSHCVAYGVDEDDAISAAAIHMQDTMAELYSDEDAEEYGEDDLGEAFTVVSAEEFYVEHEYWKYYVHPEQSQFFPLVNSND